MIICIYYSSTNIAIEISYYFPKSEKTIGAVDGEIERSSWKNLNPSLSQN